MDGTSNEPCKFQSGNFFLNHPTKVVILGSSELLHHSSKSILAGTLSRLNPALPKHKEVCRASTSVILT